MITDKAIDSELSLVSPHSETREFRFGLHELAREFIVALCLVSHDLVPFVLSLLQRGS